MKLKFKTLKDKPPFFDRTEAQHIGYNPGFTPEKQREGLNYVNDKIHAMLEDLKNLGYDTTTIQFSIDVK